MREILFRGRRVDNGEWEEGFLRGRYDATQEENVIRIAFIDNGTCFGYPVKIEPSTIGQYTGLTDKNGKKIFEGDILRYRETETDDWDVGVVEYKADHDYPAFDMTPYIDCDSNGLSYIMAACTCEAIGNIHDNPELLEESK